MNSGQRSAVVEYVFDHRSEWRKLFATSYDAHIRSNRACQIKRARQKRAAVVLHEGFVCAHARTLAAGEDESCHVMRNRTFHPAIIRSMQHVEPTASDDTDAPD